MNNLINMKRILLITVISVLMFSCHTDNKSKLEKLKQQHDQITQQINDLEKVIAKESGKESGKVAIVAVTDLKAGLFKHYIEVQGKIDGDQNIAVSPKMLGVITSINVNEGESVRAGQVLAHIDDAVLQQSLASLDTTLVYYTNLYNKQKRLWDQKIGSEVQYLNAKSNKENYENLIKTTKEQIAMATIKSPIDGTIEEIPIKVGQTVSPGVTTAFRVVNLNKIKVVADIAEAYSAKVKTGNTVQIFFPRPR